MCSLRLLHISVHVYWGANVFMTASVDEYGSILIMVISLYLTNLTVNVCNGFEQVK